MNTSHPQYLIGSMTIPVAWVHGAFYYSFPEYSVQQGHLQKKKKKKKFVWVSCIVSKRQCEHTNHVIYNTKWHWVAFKYGIWDTALEWTMQLA